MLLALARPVLAQVPPAPVAEPEVRLAFVGDPGTATITQRNVRDQIVRYWPDQVFLLGDNIYTNGEAENFKPAFLDIYAPLLQRGIPFHSALGNHDVNPCRIAEARPLPPDARAYVYDGARCDVELQLAERGFGYRGRRRYYSTTSEASPRPLAEVFVLDSNTLAVNGGKLYGAQDDAQLAWFEHALAASGAVWKIVIMHHPPHSPQARGYAFGWGGHDREVRLDNQLRPLLQRYQVDVVLAGHNHFYARMYPQDGVRYFVAGGGGRPAYSFNAARDYVASGGPYNHFVHTVITGDRFTFRAVDETGAVRDAGTWRKGDERDTDIPLAPPPPRTSR